MYYGEHAVQRPGRGCGRRDSHPDQARPNSEKIMPEMRTISLCADPRAILESQLTSEMQDLEFTIRTAANCTCSSAGYRQADTRGRLSSIAVDQATTAAASARAKRIPAAKEEIPTARSTLAAGVEARHHERRGDRADRTPTDIERLFYPELDTETLKFRRTKGDGLTRYMDGLRLATGINAVPGAAVRQGHVRGTGEAEAARRPTGRASVLLVRK